MDESAPFVSPLLDQPDEFSTGYLEDALVEFSERSKRRRLLLFTDDDDDHQTNIISKDFAMVNLYINLNWKYILYYGYASWYFWVFNSPTGIIQTAATGACLRILVAWARCQALMEFQVIN